MKIIPFNTLKVNLSGRRQKKIDESKKSAYNETEKVKRLKKLDARQKKGVIKLILFALVMLILTVLLGKPIVRAVKDPAAFRSWVEGYGIWGKILFLIMMYVQTVIAFIPGEPLEIAAGYAFGAVPGLIITLIGQTLGSITVFLFVKKYGMKLVEAFISREKIASMRFLKDEKKLEAIVFFIFLAPGTPKDALCYFVGLTPMRLGAWLLISSVARIPSVVTSTIGGNALGVGKIPMAIIVFAVTVVISVVGYWLFTRYSKMRERRRAEKLEKRRLNKLRRKERKQRILSKAKRIPLKRRRKHLSKTNA